ncbi:MAG: hypothetical protein OIF50_17305 [Flavobacteriaceae bacterium]|nr:hypothetical protein [Flavobacteriaceae bacterium]
MLAAIQLAKYSHDFDFGKKTALFMLDEFPKMNTRERIEAFNIIEKHHQYSHDFEKWYSYYRQVYKLESAIGVYNPIRYYEIAIRHYFYEKNYAKSIYFTRKKIEEMKKESVVDYTHMISLYNNIGFSYYLSSKMDSALLAYKEGLDLLKNIRFEKDDITYLRILINGNIGSSYIKLEEYDKAKELLLESKKYHDQNNIFPDNVNTYVYLGVLATRMNDMKMASSCFETAKQIYKDHGKEADATLLNITNQEIAYYECLGDNKKILELTELKSKLRLRIEAQKEQNSLLQKIQVEEYAAKNKKVLENAYLFAKEEERNKNNSKFISFVLLVILLLGVLIMLLYKLYLDKKSSERRIRQKQVIIEQHLGEKQILLSELHHRVNRNLDVISQILKNQISELGDPEMVALLQQGLSRINSISMVHRQLHHKESDKEVVFRDYVLSLVENVKRSFSAIAGEVDFKIDIKKDSHFEIDIVIPLGLIINELITNSLKHAFSGLKNSIIHIRMKQLTLQSYTLTVEDNGVNSKKGNEVFTKGTGLKLVEALAMQINGDLSYNFEDGTRVSIHFLIKD